jgi:hypothetical protein
MSLNKASFFVTSLVMTGLSLYVGYRLYRKLYPKNKRKVSFCVSLSLLFPFFFSFSSRSDLFSLLFSFLTFVLFVFYFLIYVSDRLCLLLEDQVQEKEHNVN